MPGQEFCDHFLVHHHSQIGVEVRMGTRGVVATQIREVFEILANRPG